MTKEPETGPAEPPVPAVDADALAAELEAARAEAADVQDRFLRAKAEMDNVRRRAELDAANARKFAIERFAGELIAVRDSLALAQAVELAESTDPALAQMRDGIALTLKLMDEAFRKCGIEVLNPQGERFDPERHHALSMIESVEVAPNHIVTVVQRGYLLHERVLRPAMVMVAKPPAGGNRKPAGEA